MNGDYAPQLVDLTDRVLFGEVWEHQDLLQYTVAVFNTDERQIGELIGE